ncbi:putative O-glycosylation ligase, exosortase A system-associated [Sabulicella glaciei]|uniref:O-glycosylation ligase, exosortase A system-associated n=1 Tax=Sabulicella glaciei TaxID=2984948 RepID=A0ABT3NRL5_9PROT|nr:putative O-glycosylation ligase, exosortase A system-associated [Roseococcus sp. MDT2-1-1]MCW8084802.1 putative O-glycosylation ligase, exosortase A system-associated [Roseococcus sp. MDT2-1-1]
MRDIVFFGICAPWLVLATISPFAGILIWSWISFMNPHQLVWGFARTPPWAMLAFMATVVGCVLAGEPKRAALNSVTVLLLAFLAWITLTSMIALAPPSAVWPMWDRVMKVILGLLLTAALLTSRDRIHAMVWMMVLSLGYFGVRGGIFTLVTGGGHIVLGPEQTMIADRNHLAVGMLISIPLMNWLRLHSKYRLIRIGLIAAMGLTLVAVLGSQSRGALLALIATGGVLWLRSRGKVVSGIAIVAAVAGAIAFMPQTWVSRMETMQNYEEDASATGRILIWMSAYEMARERPLTGGGFRAVYQQEIVDRLTPGVAARATHSIWFEVLGEHGWVGFGIWFALLLAGIWQTFRLAALARGQPKLRWAWDLARMSQVSIVAYMAGGTFLSLSYWDYFWTLLVVVAAARAVVLRQARQETERVRTVATGGWRSRAQAA